MSEAKSVWEKTKSFFQWCRKWFIESKIARAIWLSLGVYLGWLILNGNIPSCLSPAFYTDMNWGIGDEPRARAYFLQFIAALPTVALLWIFRTYDIRQQIAKTEEQIRQNNFAEAVRLLMVGEMLQINTGIKILLDISKVTTEFDSQIRAAFVTRLGKLPDALYAWNPVYENAETAKRRHRDSGVSLRERGLSYAVPILNWLKDNLAGETFTLSNPEFFYKEFPRKAEISSKDIGDVLELIENG